MPSMRLMFLLMSCHLLHDMVFKLLTSALARCSLAVSTGRQPKVSPQGMDTCLGHVLTLISESLKQYFSQYGEVSECTVMRDSATGRSRGFGFLTFRDAKCVNTVMVKEHYLDGKIVSLRHTLPPHSNLF